MGCSILAEHPGGAERTGGADRARPLAQIRAQCVFRHDYEGIETAKAEKLFAELRGKLPGLPGTEVCGLRIEAADDFAYTDPVIVSALDVRA